MGIEIFRLWAEFGGIIFDAGYIITLVVMVYRQDGYIVPVVSYLAFLIATMGYCGYFAVVQPDGVMLIIACVGLVLIMANIMVAIQFRAMDKKKSSGGISHLFPHAG